MPPIIPTHLDEIATASPVMERCLAMAREAARSDLPILLQGETGTGKTLLAQAIHQSSRRTGAPFVSFNASAMSETLLESQLFGHEKGAFTGATDTRKGKFEQAHEGTLFFDEIADMSPQAQAKILRAVEYGEFERLGGERMRQADVRIISATNRHLRRLVQHGEFREDLYHRLNGLTLHLPALRERQEDLPGLIALELRSCARAVGKDITGIDPEAFEKLLAYHWPGNLRELHRVVQGVVLFCRGEIVQPEDVVLDDWEDLSPVPVSGASVPASLPSPTANASPAPSEDLTLATAIRRHLESVLARCAGNKSQAARRLGISRSTLDRRLAAD